MLQQIFTLFFYFSIHSLLALSTDPSLGVRTFEYIDSHRQRPVTVELWYPTEDTAASDTPTENAEWIHPQEIRNASLSKQYSNYPLILMSHGHRGDRRERSWLADILAKKGYLIASIDHYGDTRSTFDPLVSVRFWERALDCSFALNQLLQESFIQNQFDVNKIGFIGYSLGGMTGLALAGARAYNTRNIVLQTIKGYGEAVIEKIAQIDFSISEKSYLEPRIKAMLLICPATFVYPEHNLREIKIPIGLIATIGDEVLPHQHHAYKIIKNAIPARLKVMRKEISHYSFLNQISKMGEKIFHKASQANPPCCSRSLIHKEAGLFAIDFFKEALKKK